MLLAAKVVLALLISTKSAVALPAAFIKVVISLRAKLISVMPFAFRIAASLANEPRSAVKSEACIARAINPPPSMTGMLSPRAPVTTSCSVLLPRLTYKPLAIASLLVATPLMCNVSI